MKRVINYKMRLHELGMRYEAFRNLNWIGAIPTTYLVQVFENKDNSGGIIALSDNGAERISWAVYHGKNPLKGEVGDSLDDEETKFLSKKYPALFDALIKLN
jgi:hypothetical protein